MSGQMMRTMIVIMLMVMMMVMMIMMMMMMMMMMIMMMLTKEKDEGVLGEPQVGDVWPADCSVHYCWSCKKL